MKIAAITTFPPSTNILATFGYEAIRKFLKLPDVDELIVLCEKSADEDTFFVKPDRVVVDRCWSINSAVNTISIANKVHAYSPDVVWMNLQYTVFGHNPVSAFLGLLILPILKLMRYPVVAILHNYYSVIDIEELGLRNSLAIRLAMKFLDPIIMKFVTSADKIFVMEKDYFDDLRKKYPTKNVEFVEQDLYDLPQFQPVNRKTRDIVTFGWYGTYKRLEVLLDAFQEVRCEIPDARLIIAGTSHPQTPTYLRDLFQEYLVSFDKGVKYVGYVRESSLPELFWNANVVVLTNNIVTGSSTALRFAAIYGRGAIVPDVSFYSKLDGSRWGIIKYEKGNSKELSRKIISVLSDYELQASLGLRNYQSASLWRNGFTSAHEKAFEELFHKNIDRK